jgi:type II secretory pathway pseudopilin PulG
MLGASARSSRRMQRGLSIVELMVGLALGLFVVAGATVVTSTQLGDNRRLLLETQLQQDLRSSADIIARELRRAGYWSTAEESVWTPTANASPNLFSTVATPSTTQVDFKYRRGPGQEGPYGFKLDTGTGTLRTMLAAAGWQDLTDTRTMRITNLSITPEVSPEQVLPCPRLCADGTDSCWPRVSNRRFLVDITGQSVSDASFQRQLRTYVRVRNDLVRFTDAANPNRMCPE